ncbi:DUF6777 domain-containing protein [Streptomyces sp. NPDC051561]|uniref:DUF6777 domain-containing protein n=1 Tax=Streptomyces sp. NPDC051561 TaxID=3365658 RepID=UPI00379BAC7B
MSDPRPGERRPARTVRPSPIPPGPRHGFSRTRRRTVAAAVSVVSLGLLAAGCGSGGSGQETGAAGSQDVLLQPVAAQGPDPFTESTAKSGNPLPSTSSPAPSRTAASTSSTPSASARTTHRISGGTPGLYGGTRSLSSCDVEQQVRYLTGSAADGAKADAFAQASRIDRAAIPGFLRGLTPVVLRVDTRVTNHGFGGGSLTSFQSVLQAGTAVLVDSNGMPRVRCACGNPLLPPSVVRGTVTHQGQPWTGYRPANVIVVTPAPVVVNNLTIVNIVNNTWIERETGTEGERDKTPSPGTELPPPPSPDALHERATVVEPGDGQEREPGDEEQTSPGSDTGTSETPGTPSDDGTTPGSTDSGTADPDTADPGTTDPTATEPDDTDTAPSTSPDDTSSNPSGTTPENSSGIVPPATSPCPTLTPGVPVTTLTPNSPVPPGCPTPTPSRPGPPDPQLPSGPDTVPDGETGPGPDGG